MWNRLYMFLLHVYFISYFETTYIHAFFSPEQTYEGLPCSQYMRGGFLSQSGWSICQPHFYIADPLQVWVSAQPAISRLISLISLLLHSPLNSWVIFLLFIAFWQMVSRTHFVYCATPCQYLWKVVIATWVTNLLISHPESVTRMKNWKEFKSVCLCIYSMYMTLGQR